jgi:peptide/histidine transporter 3/4
LSRSHRSSVGSYYPPDPADAVERKSVLKGTAGYIIVTEFCERLAYYGFAGSLVLFFEVISLPFLRIYSSISGSLLISVFLLFDQTQLNYSMAEADVQYSAWSGFCYVTPLLGGYIADTYLGRYKTILVRASSSPAFHVSCALLSPFLLSVLFMFSSVVRILVIRSFV